MAHADNSTVETAIRARLTSLDSGNYRSNNELVLRRFAAYLREHREITDLEDLDVIDCRRYAQWLRQRANDENDQLSAASAHEGGRPTSPSSAPSSAGVSTTSESTLTPRGRTA